MIEENLTFKGKDEYSDYAGAVEIDLSAPQAADGVSVSGSTVTISAAGTYVLTGTLADGQVVVAAGENDDVRLVLENASISSASTAPVYVKSADKVILSLPEGTESYVADAVTGTDGEDTLTGAIYAACDLSINGSGTLRIEAGANDAISTKDDLRITGGTLEITAADDGLVANDGILIRGGTLRSRRAATASRPQRPRRIRALFISAAVRSRLMRIATAFRRRRACWFPAALWKSRRAAV